MPLRLSSVGIKAPILSGLSLFLLALAFLAVLIPGACAQPSEAALIRGSSASGSNSWDARDFGWFYYDLDEDLGGESLSVQAEGRRVVKDHLKYSSHAWDESFEFEPWGSYSKVAFLGKPYFSGYHDSDFTDAVSSLDKGELREILIDDDETHAIVDNTTFPLAGGYSLGLRGVSSVGEEADLVLLKGQVPVHRAVVTVGGTYVYKVGDMPVILAHLSKSMSGSRSVAEIDGLFQIVESPIIRLSEGIKVDRLEITEVSGDLIELRNYGDLTLRRDSATTLIGGLALRVLDEDGLSYYPQGLVTDYGIKDIRGTVFGEGYSATLHLGGQKTYQAAARWNAENYTGFYLDPEEPSLANETLTILGTKGRIISSIREKPEVINGTPHLAYAEYVSYVKPLEFQYKPWGTYNVISLLGQLWFVGYENSSSPDLGGLSTIDYDQACEILLDSDQVNRAVAGNVFMLANGYQFLVREVENDKIFAQLMKNDKILDNATITSNTTYVYKADVGDVNDLPIVAIHVQNVFSNGTLSLAVVDGIFQISDYSLPIDEGRDFGEMTIIESNPMFVGMVNLDPVELKRDSVVGIIPGSNIRVADNESLRYYIYTQKYIVPRPVLSYLSYPVEGVPSLGLANFTMLVKAGEITSVIAEIADPMNRTVFIRDLTGLGVGSGDEWIYSWRWKAEAFKLSDGGSIIPLSDQELSPALLYLNSTFSPVPVAVKFNQSGVISSITDKSTIYYISPSEYAVTGKDKGRGSYGEMLLNETARRENIKIVLGESLLKFTSLIEGTTILEVANHTLSGSLETLEPHLVQIPAPAGPYKLSLRIENIMDALRITDVIVNVTAPKVMGASLGSGRAEAGGLVSIPLKVWPPVGEKRVEIAYDPKVVNALEAGGECVTPSYIDHKAGRISVILPANCTSTNVTFQAEDIRLNAASNLDIVRVEGLEPQSLENGSIEVAGRGSRGKSGLPLPMGFQAVPLAIVALMMAAAARRRL